ncbi:MAG: transcriptional regulator [Ignavibacteriae bacterium]|nr:MAG: transcriptional regulator [Ignavibacteriota bacterium]
MRYSTTNISAFLKLRRREELLTQVELADKAGVGLRFVRDLEQGKKTVRLDKVNQVLALFGAKVGVVPWKESDDE